MLLRKRMEVLVDEMLDGKILLGEAVMEFEKIYIERAVAKFGTQVTKTAAALGIHRNTLSKHLDHSKNGSSPKKTKPPRPKPKTAKARRSNSARSK